MSTESERELYRAQTNAARLPHPVLNATQISDNRERAERGSDIIDKYRHTFEEWEPDHEVLTDILADLMHASAGQSQLDFDGCLEIARQHFNAEQHGNV